MATMNPTTEAPPTRRGADLRPVRVPVTPHPELLLQFGLSLADVIKRVTA